MTLLLHSGRIASLSGAGFLSDGALLVDDEGTIADLGPSARVAPPEVRESFAGEVVDLRGRVVLPGQINAHMHLYSTLARGMPLLPGEPPADFRGVLETLWWPLDRALDEESVYLSALFGLMDSLRAGVTTVIDHHASEGWIPGSLEAVSRAARDLGVRVCTCFETTDRDGAQVSAAGLAENVAFAAACRADPWTLGGAPSRAATLGLHASLTLEDATLEAARAAIEEHDLPGVHVHVSEDRADPVDSLARSGVRTVERLHRAGLLGPRSIAVHAIWVEDHEVQLLAESGTLVVTNPSSNMNNGVGRCDVARLRAGGVRMAVGTDGMHGDVLGELAQTYFAIRDQAGDPRVGFDHAAALWEGNRAVAEAVFPGAGLGTLVKGGPADLAILDYDPWTPLDGENLLGHVLYGGLGARVQHVLCAGRWVLRDRAFPTLSADVAEVTARARVAARSMWERRRAPGA
jgi:putative selenium metabolism protein SsnA